MAYYNVCPYCGSNLDPGETCDCQTQETTVRDKKRATILNGNGNSSTHIPIVSQNSENAIGGINK